MFNIHFNGVKKVLVAAAVTVTLGGVSSYGISAPAAVAAGVSKGQAHSSPVTIPR